MTATAVRRDEVHVWWIDADSTRLPTPVLLERLTGAERTRVAALPRERDRRRRAVAHLALADIRRRYGSVGPLDRRCRWCGDPAHGKPRAPGAVDVSLSHAGSRAVVAVAARPCLVGVDIEPATATVRPDAVRRALGRRADGLAAHAGPVAAWCRLEAVGKATGHGTLGAAPHVRVSTPAGASAAGLTWYEATDDKCRPWRLHDLAPPDGYVGALAVLGEPTDIRQYTWHDEGVCADH